MGPRFPAVSDAYDGELQDIIIKCGEKLGLQVQDIFFVPNSFSVTIYQFSLLFYHHLSLVVFTVIPQILFYVVDSFEMERV